MTSPRAGVFSAAGNDVAVSDEEKPPELQNQEGNSNIQEPQVNAQRLPHLDGRYILTYEPSGRFGGQGNWPEKFNKVFFFEEGKPPTININYITQNLFFNLSNQVALENLYQEMEHQYSSFVLRAEPFQEKWVPKYIHKEKKYGRIFYDYHGEIILNERAQDGQGQEPPCIEIRGKRYILYKIGICAANSASKNGSFPLKYTLTSDSEPQDAEKYLEKENCGNFGMVFGQEGTRSEEEKIDSNSSEVYKKVKYERTITLNFHIHDTDKQENNIKKVSRMLEKFEGFFSGQCRMLGENLEYMSAIDALFQHDDFFDEIHRNKKIFSGADRTKDILNELRGINKPRWRRLEEDGQQSMGPARERSDSRSSSQNDRENWRRDDSGASTPRENPKAASKLQEEERQGPGFGCGRRSSSIPESGNNLFNKASRDNPNSRERENSSVSPSLSRRPSDALLPNDNIQQISGRERGGSAPSIPSSLGKPSSRFERLERDREENQGSRSVFERPADRSPASEARSGGRGLFGGKSKAESSGNWRNESNSSHVPPSRTHGASKPDEPPQPPVRGRSGSAPPTAWPTGGNAAAHLYPKKSR